MQRLLQAQPSWDESGSHELKWVWQTLSLEIFTFAFKTHLKICHFENRARFDWTVTFSEFTCAKWCIVKLYFCLSLWNPREREESQRAADNAIATSVSLCPGTLPDCALHPLIPIPPSHRPLPKCHITHCVHCQIFACVCASARVKGVWVLIPPLWVSPFAALFFLSLFLSLVSVWPLFAELKWGKVQLKGKPTLQ